MKSTISKNGLKMPIMMSLLLLSVVPCWSWTLPTTQSSRFGATNNKSPPPTFSRFQQRQDNERLSSTTKRSPLFFSNHNNKKSTSLKAAASAAVVMDFTPAALSFFTSIRVPAALIAGASLSSLFDLVKSSDSFIYKKDYHNIKREEAIQDWLARVCGVLCFTALVLSLNVVMTATTTSTTLLLQTASTSTSTVAKTAYDFMTQNLRYPFLTTRWSFLTAILCFVAGTATRCLLSFHLFGPGRERIAAIVTLSMTALLAHFLSYMNSCLHCWPNMGVMTLDLIRAILGKAIRQKKPLELLSVLCLVCSIGLTLPMLHIRHGNDDDKEKENKEEEQESSTENDKRK